MARKPASNLATVDDEGNVIDTVAPQLPIIDDEGPADIALETALMQLGAETENCARVIIYRQVREAGKVVEEWLHETTPADFNESGLAGIAREWGSGTYRVRIFVPGEVGFRSNKVIRVAAPKDTLPMAQAQAQVNSGLGELAGAMMQGFQKLGELIVASAPKPDSEAEVIRKMAMYKELFAPPMQAAAPTAEPGFQAMFEVLKQGMEMGRMGAGEPSSMDALMKGLEVFGPVVQQAMHQQAPAPAAAMAHPAALPAAPVPVQTAPEDDMNMRALQLKAALAFLVKQARNGADPYTYANVVLDQLAEDEVQGLMNNPNWLDWLTGVNADIKEPGIQAWFVQLRSAIVELLTPEVEAGNDGAHANTAPESDAIPGQASHVDAG